MFALLAQGAIKANWLKGIGAERPFALRIMGLGSKLAVSHGLQLQSLWIIPTAAVS